LGGRLQFWIGRAEEALDDFDQAARLAREAGDSGEEAVNLHYVVTALAHGPTPADEALRRIDEIQSQAGLDRRFELSVLITRGWLEGMRARFDVAWELFRQGQELGEELGMEVTLVGHKSRDLGSVQLLAGNGEAATRELRPACERLEEMGELGYLSSVAPLLADALFMQGLDEEALLVTDRWHPDRLTVPEDADAQAGWRRVRGKVLARRGDVEEGERLARQAMEIAGRTDHLTLRGSVAADLAAVLRLAGRGEEAEAAEREALRLFEAKGNKAAVRLLAVTSDQ
jgi:tetratricopeptide (TPR) repeat protein